MAKGKWIAVLLIAGLMQACGTINPYHDDTMCPALEDYGECVSMMKAYKEGDQRKPAAKAKSPKAPTESGAVPQPNSVTSTPQPAQSELTYRKALYREMATLLDAPKTPLRRPPTIRRILVTPYEDHGTMFMPRYLFVVIDNGGWILDELPDRGQGKSVELFSEHEK